MEDLKHEPSLNPPEPETLTLDCGHEADLGDTLFELGGELICAACFREHLSGISERCLPALSEALGIPVRFLADIDHGPYGLTWPCFE